MTNPLDSFENLITRFEEPNSMARWDSPLFTVSSLDPLPADAIWQSVTSGAKAPLNVAVLQVRKHFAFVYQTKVPRISVEHQTTHGRLADPRKYLCHGGECTHIITCHDVWLWGRRPLDHIARDESGHQPARPQYLSG